ncbi:hypothetical protein OAO87_01190 [bacterium]|nr:hypothetical protein [bacterium]
MQVQDAFSEYYTGAKILHNTYCTEDRAESIENLLHHEIISVVDAVDDVSVIFSDFLGFLSSSSTRYLNTAITGQVTIRLTFAPQSVLTYKEAGVAFGSNLSNANAQAAAAAVSYSATNLHATCDVLSFGDAYDAMLMQRLTTEEFLPINFDHYYSFSQHGIRSGAHTMRFSLSATSIDSIFVVHRNANYLDAGIKGQTYTATATQGPCSTCNALFFRSFNNSNTKLGSYRYKFTVNNVSHYQYDANVLDAAHSLALLANRVPYSHTRAGMTGGQIHSLTDYNAGKFVVPLSLNLPSEPNNVMSGFSSRGANTSFSYEAKGMTPDVVDPTNNPAQLSADLSTYVLVKTTAQLRISSQRQVAVAYW